MSERSAFSAENCSVARTLAIVGEKWSLLVLREAFYGVRRFSDFQAALGIARNLLTVRLAMLVEHGIMRRETYQVAGSRSRQEYRLTAKGLELFPTLVALMQWGDKHLADPAGPAVVIRHNQCHLPVRAILECGAGHRPLTVHETHPTPGPGARHRVLR